MSHFKVFVDEIIFSKAYWEKELIEPAGETGLSVVLDDTITSYREKLSGWNAPHSFHSLLLLQFTETYFEDFAQPSKTKCYPGLEIFLHSIQPILETLKNLQSQFRGIIGNVEWNRFSFLYFGNEVSLHFSWNFFLNYSIQKKMWNEMIAIIEKSRSSHKKTINWLTSVPIQSNNLRFLDFGEKEGKWFLVNRVIESTQKVSEEYLKDVNDSRIRKPLVIFNQDNYNQYFVWDHQWKLRLEEIPLILAQPNDIALYVRLAEKNASAAEKQFKDEYRARNKPFYRPLLTTEDTLQIYDYFELVIAAITFAYTSLETLANICIPSNYKYKVSKNGVTTIYTKVAIERKFLLRDKFKIILKDVLQTPDPTKESWWGHFLHLENIRNEIIHTKQSKSEERYSLFLSKKVFQWINIYKKVIPFYGYYINQQQRALLIDFPYGFGFENTQAAFMTKEDYDQHWREMHGVPDLNRTE